MQFREFEGIDINTVRELKATAVNTVDNNNRCLTIRCQESFSK
jgi:hypothetical protein